MTDWTTIRRSFQVTTRVDLLRMRVLVRVRETVEGLMTLNPTNNFQGFGSASVTWKRTQKCGKSTLSQYGLLRP